MDNCRKGLHSFFCYRHKTVPCILNCWCSYLVYGQLKPVLSPVPAKQCSPLLKLSMVRRPSCSLQWWKKTCSYSMLFLVWSDFEVCVCGVGIQFKFWLVRGNYVTPFGRIFDPFSPLCNTFIPYLLSSNVMSSRTPSLPSLRYIIYKQPLSSARDHWSGTAQIWVPKKACSIFIFFFLLV
jgi:hypothetical protein